MAGRTGLDYNILFRVLDDRFKDPVEWQSVFEDLQTIEGEALTFWSESK